MKNPRARLCIASVLAIASWLPGAASLTGAEPPPAAVADTTALAIFADAGVGGWNCHAETADAPVHSGTRSLRLDLGRGSAQLEYLYGHYTMTTRPFTHLGFWIHGGEKGGQSIRLVSYILGSSWQGQASVRLDEHLAEWSDGGAAEIPAGSWIHVRVPLAAMGVAERDDFRALTFTCDDRTPASPCFLDDVRLEGPVANRAKITVDAAAQGRTVDDRIFGVCTYGVPSIAAPAEVQASREAGYRLHRVFYPTFNLRPGMKPNPQRGLLFAEASGAAAIACVNYSDMEADARPASGRSFGTPQEAAAWVAYANAEVGGPTAKLDFGIDANGAAWGTVDDWARLRASTDAGDLSTGMIAGRDYAHLRIAHRAPFKVELWELDNEPWMHAKEVDWLGYANFCKQADALMKRVNPAVPIKTGVTLILGGDPGTVAHPQVVNPADGKSARGFDAETLYFLAGHDQSASPGRLVPDFVVVHTYAGTDDGPTADVGSLLTYQTDALSWTRTVERYRRELRDFYGDDAAAAKPSFVVTENNLRSTFPLNRQMHSIVSALYLADDLGGMLQTGDNDIVGMTWHDWDDGDLLKGGYRENPAMAGWRTEGGYNIYAWNGVEGVATRYPTHYAFRLLAQGLARSGDRVVGCSSSSPLLRAFAVHQRSGNLAVLLLNLAPTTTVDASLTFAGYTPAAMATIATYGSEEDRLERDITQAPLAYRAGQPLRLAPWTLTLATFTTATTPGGAPVAPPSLVTCRPRDGRPELQWTAVSGATGYDVLRAVDGAQPVVAARGVRSAPWRDAEAHPGSALAYKVVTIAGSARSSASEALHIAATSLPAGLAGLQAVPAVDGVELIWPAVDVATHYRVERAIGSAPFTLADPNVYARRTDQRIERTRWVDRAVAPGQAARWRVTPWNDAGDGGSAEASGSAIRLPPPWRVADLAGRADGLTRYSGDTWEVRGSGYGWYGGGEGRFVSQPLSGDGSISARVLAVPDRGQYGKNLCGVMLRATPAGREGPWAMLGITPAGAYGAGFITSANGGGQFQAERNQPRSEAPAYVRLERAGREVRASLSTDGTQWTPFANATFDGLPDNVEVGLVVNSMTHFSTASGTFDHVRVEKRR